MKSMRRIEEVALPEDLSFDEIVKNTWKNAIGGWNIGKKDESETKELTRAEKRRNEKRKKRKKNPIFEMMINMATKGATKYVMNKLGLEHSRSREEKKKRGKFNPFKVFWGIGGDSDEVGKETGETELERESFDEEDVEEADEKMHPAIMTLDLDELL